MSPLAAIARESSKVGSQRVQNQRFEPVFDSVNLAASAAVEVETAQVLLPSGVRLNYVDSAPAGRPDDNPTVLMLHGLSDSSFSFSRVMPRIARDFRAIAIDQRGHGESDRPDRGYTVDDFANDTLAFMDALRIEQAILIGHSMGSFVARRVAARAPERLSRLVLVGSGLIARTPAMAELITALGSMSDPIDEQFIHEFQWSCVYQPLATAFMERVIAESRKVPARVWKAAAAGMWNFEPGAPIVVPTTLICGERDTVFSRADHAALARSIAGCVLHVEPDIGHTLQWEAPDRFVELALS